MCALDLRLHKRAARAVDRFDISDTGVKCGHSPSSVLHSPWWMLKVTTQGQTLHCVHQKEPTPSPDVMKKRADTKPRRNVCAYTDTCMLYI